MKPEDREQMALIRWIELSSPNLKNWVVTVRNEVAGGVVIQRKVNRMGRRKGAADIFIALPTLRYHGFWLELKAPKSYLKKKDGVASAAQREFLIDMAAVGYHTAVCVGWIAAAKAICKYLSVEWKISWEK